MYKALECFQNQAHLFYRQTRWMEYLAQFNYSIEYVKGITNKVADSLFRYFESDKDGEVYPYNDYVSANIKLDPDDNDLPLNHFQEHQSLWIGPSNLNVPLPHRRLILRSELFLIEQNAPADIFHEDPFLFDIKKSIEPLNNWFSNNEGFIRAIQCGYRQDTTFSKILDNPGHYKDFRRRDELLYTTNRFSESVLCMP